MNITMLSMQQDQELHAAEIVANINHSDSQVEFLEYSKNISDGLDSIEEASQTSATLESIKNLLANNKEEIPACAAQALKLSIEHMSARLGYKKTFSSLSMESYSNDPKRNVRIALEGLGSFIKSVIQAIINSIKKVVGWFTGFFTKSKETAKQTERRCDAFEHQWKPKIGDPKYMDFVNKDVKDITVLLEPDHHAHNSDLVLSLNTDTHPLLRFKNNGVLIIEPILEQTYEILKQETNRNIGSLGVKAAKEFSTELFKKIKEKDQVGISDFLSKEDGIFDSMAPGLNHSLTPINLDDEKQCKESGPLLGDYCIYFTEPANTFKLTSDLHISCGVDKCHNYQEFTTKKELSLYSLNFNLKIAELIKKNSTPFASEEIVNDYKKLLEEITKELSSLEKNNGEDGGSISKAIKALQSVVGMITKGKIKYVVESTAFHQKLNSSVMSFIEHCGKIHDYMATLP
jgi:very-short-patch-repair endonuclease